MQILRCMAAIVLVVMGMGWPRGVSATLSPPVSPPSVSVATIDGAEHLSVSAGGSLLRALLSEVAHRAGFTITGTVAAERPISVEFQRVPLDRALKKLLSGENFIFLYDQPVEGGPAKLQRVILLGSGTSAPEGTGSEPAAEPADGTPAVPAVVEPAAVIPEGAEAFDPDGPLEDLLPLIAHQDPRMRTAALEALTLHADDERARRTLMEHIADPDPTIRTVVVGLLGPFVTQWPGAEAVVLTAALHDPTPEVRQLALLTLSEASSTQGLEALHRARQDADPEVRTRAEELLQDVAHEEPSDHPPR
jgi:hypothetical protein